MLPCSLRPLITHHAVGNTSSNEDPVRAVAVSLRDNGQQQRRKQGYVSDIRQIRILNHECGLTCPCLESAPPHTPIRKEY